MAQNRENGINGLLGNQAQFQQLQGLHLSLNPNQFQQQSAQHVVQQQIPPMEPFQFLSRPMFDNTVLQISQQYNHQFVQPVPVQSPLVMKTPRKQNDGNENSQSFDLKFLDESSFRTPSKLDPKTKSLCELQRISIHGCESAARIFQTHSKRPYFKKIDLLCDRLKQDLSVTNKAVVNINSHGVAWAIKDFIFVFNRIINAWVIMRDYFYSNSEGMQCVKESMDSNFAQDFLIWQEATSKLAKSLVNSYENLHVRDQRNGNRKGTKSDSNVSSPAGSARMNDPFQKIFDPLIAENTEKLQLSGNYLKSAVYKPLSSSEDSTPPDTPGSNADHSYDSFRLLFNEMMPENAFLERSGNPKPLYKRGTAESTPGNFTQYRLKMSLAEQFDSLGVKETEDFDGIKPLDVDEEEVKMLPMAGVFSFDVLQHFYGVDGAKKIICLFNDVLSMPEALSFVERKEGEDWPHAPSYIENGDGPSLTQTIACVHEGKFKTVNDIFIAVKMMAEYAKALLQYNQGGDGQQMKEIVVKFVCGVELALARYA